MGVIGQSVVNHVVTAFIPLVLSLAVHEWGHAIAATALGDPTPREQGRLTLNPVAHFDWLGSIVLPLGLIAFGLPIFGWARPVEVSPQRFTRRLRMRTGVWLTAAAGPAMNLALAAVGAILWVASVAAGKAHSGPSTFLEELFTLNVVLFVLNLLPIPPLDGSRVLRGAIPPIWRRWGPVIERVGPILLSVLLLTGAGTFLIRGPSLALDAQLEHAAVSVLRWARTP